METEWVSCAEKADVAEILGRLVLRPEAGSQLVI